jgi:P22_AR N-terminal domain
VSADLVPVPVPGADLPMQAAQIEGRVFVAFRPLCDSLGVDPDTQAKKLRSRSWATTVLTAVVAADGRSRDMLMVDRRTLTMWLATLDERRVGEAARERVIAYQAQAADALDAYFNKRVVTAPPVNQFDVLRAAIDQIEAAQRDATEAKQIAQRTDARLAAIEGRHDWFSALAFARLNDLPTHTAYLRRLGACATRIAKAHDITANRVQHQLYGMVNSYPAWVWDLAAEGFEA